MKTVNDDAIKAHPRSSQYFRKLSVGFFCLLVVVVASTFRQYGVGWDENFHKEYGALVYSFYATVFDTDPDLGALNYRDLHLKGGFFDLVGFVLNRLLPFGEYENRHLWNAIVGIFGVLACWKAVRCLSGPRAALFAALTLILIPSYYGHMFNNTKDVPFAVGYMWSIYYLIRTFPHFPVVPVSLSIRLGIAVGLSLAVRAGGLILFAYFALAIVVFSAYRAWRGKVGKVAKVGKVWHITIAPKEFPWNETRQLFMTFGLVFVVAYGIMLAFWPYAAVHPVTGAFSALRELSNFDWRGEMLFRGEVISSTDIPWLYIPQYLLIQLPEFVIGLLALGSILGLHYLITSRDESRLTRGAPYFFLLFVSTFPIAYIIYQGSTVYDAARHVIFVLPVLACLVGLTADVLVRCVARQGPLWSGGVGVLAVGLLTIHVNTMIALHPYQYVYFNAFVGGLAGAANEYETDYWAQSYRETVLELSSLFGTESTGQGTDTRRYFVYVVGPSTPATYYFPDNFEATRDIDEAHFAITFTRNQAHTTWDGKDPFIIVQRFGVPLSYVFYRPFSFQEPTSR